MNLLYGSAGPKVMRTAGVGEAELFFLVIGRNRDMLVVKVCAILLGLIPLARISNILRTLLAAGSSITGSFFSSVPLT